jgi:hypothetical protein
LRARIDSLLVLPLARRRCRTLALVSPNTPGRFTTRIRRQAVSCDVGATEVPLQAGHDRHATPPDASGGFSSALRTHDHAQVGASPRFGQGVSPKKHPMQGGPLARHDLRDAKRDSVVLVTVCVQPAHRPCRWTSCLTPRRGRDAECASRRLNIDVRPGSQCQSSPGRTPSPGRSLLDQTQRAGPQVVPHARLRCTTHQT